MKRKFVPVKTEEEADILVRHVEATLFLDGMVVPDDEKAILKEVALGNIPYEKYLKQVRES